MRPKTELSFKDVSYVRGKRRVLDHARAIVRFRGILSLRGPNGAGKTGVLKLMVGLVRPESGEIFIDGLPPVRAREFIGYMPQIDESTAAALPAWVFVACAINGCRWGFGANGKRKKGAFELLAQCHADHLVDRAFGDLSGGERQRVRLASALATRPRLLLLDEPFAGVDAQGREKLASLLRDLAYPRAGKEAEIGLDIVLAEHDMRGMDLFETMRMTIEGGKLHVGL